MPSRSFRKRIRDAAGDCNLRIALDRAAAAYAEARAEAFEGVDFEQLRTELRAVREASLGMVPELFERFRREAERIDARVHQAADADEAGSIVLDLASSHGVRKVVKAKSMLTEEVELNRRLLSEGIEVTETDLGEWICQLAGDRPSHFTAPAIHRTREEIAELFSKVTGEPVDADIPSLVEVARKQMRQAFVEADMGVSGANIAIADTGTIVIVSNEGNARLVTSLPEIHVALVGYEKLVPSIDEAAAIIKLLSRSGTGQRMTSYISFITGPSRTSDIEKTLTLGAHGPRELHIIFVDNGRLALLDDPEFREALYCIKCGACLNICPVYLSVGGHVFGRTYIGGIGAILTAFYAGLMEAEEIVNICSACRRCTSYCPVKIDIPRMIVGLRRKLAEARGLPWVEQMLLRNVLAKPKRLDSAIRLARRAQKVLVPKAGGSLNLPFPFSGLTRFRSLPALAETSLRERLSDESLMPKPAGKKLGTVAFFPGCVVDYVYPEIGEAAVNLLAGLGWEVKLPKDQGCCGIPALLKGDAETACALAKHNVNIADFQSADYVVTVCPTCAMALKEDFVRLLGVESPDGVAASQLAAKVHDFSEFLVNVGKATGKKLGDPGAGQQVTYHDSCHARHGLGVSIEPRELLRLAGYEVVEMSDSNACCGFAGSYSFYYPEVSESILRRKLQNVIAAGASIVATDCPGCLLQLRGGLEKMRKKIRVAHIAELLAPIESS